jgi:hypothetical protein
MVNQRGEPVVETILDSAALDEADLREVVGMLLDYFHLEVVQTNATKHGNVALELREVQ